MTDKNYESQRNKLIPAAEKFADKNAGRMPKSTTLRKEMTLRQKKKMDKLKSAWDIRWNLAFHSKMNELAASK